MLWFYSRKFGGKLKPSPKHCVLGSEFKLLETSVLLLGKSDGALESHAVHNTITILCCSVDLSNLFILHN